jgi:hypothetical protein
MNKLFDEQELELSGPKAHNADSYTYYAASSRTEVIVVRSQMEAWFSDYPDEEKDDLRNNFKNDFDAGFFELFLYTLFCRMGYNVHVHPIVPNSSKRPDFLVSGFGEEFYLEAKVSFYESPGERARERMLGSLYAVLDKANVPNFYIYLRSIKLKGNQQPRGKVIKKAIEDTYKGYDVDELLENMGYTTVTRPPSHIYEDDDVYIEYSPMPINAESKGRADRRAIGMYGGGAKIIENGDSLRKALKMKAGRYGVLDKPYLIAINAIDMMSLDKDEVMDCLMGSTLIDPKVLEPDGSFKEFRDHDGFFTGRNDGGQNTRVSAVFITKINPGNWETAEYWIMENEKATKPLNLRKSLLITRFVEDNVIYRTQGQSFSEIFG